MTGMPDVAVILLTFNQREKTLRCLESLSRLVEPQPRVLLWDNGSHDGTAEAARARYPAVHVHVHPTNAGVSGGRNQAAALAQHRWEPSFLLFLDNDMTVEADCVEKLLEPFRRNARIGITTGKIRVLGQSQRLYGAGGCVVDFRNARTGHVGHGEVDDGQYDTPRECIASGGCLMVRTELFRRLGGFDLSFNPYGPEDLDFGLRARTAGAISWYVPSAVVRHELHPGHTAVGGMASATYIRNKARFWFVLFRRHAPLGDRLLFYLFGGPRTLLRLSIRELRRGNLAPVHALFGGGRRAPKE